MRGRRKTVIAALSAVVVVAILVSNGASAGAHTPATFEFSNKASEDSLIVSRPDGTGTTAHHVLSIPSFGEITCLAAEFKGTVSSLKTTVLENLSASYIVCKSLASGEAMDFSMGGCDLAFTAAGELNIAGAPGESCVNKPMTFTTAGGCVISIPEQTLSGLGYTNISFNGLGEVTMSMSLTKVSGSRGAKCAKPGTFTGGEYKTGNTIIGAQEDNATKGAVSMKWAATVP